MRLRISELLKIGLKYVRQLRIVPKPISKEASGTPGPIPYILILRKELKHVLVEPRRIELLTSCVQGRRSPS